jgi:plasmid stabilization system protein ParE
MRVILSRKANLDLLDQLDWLLERSPRAARKAEQTIKASLRNLAQFPFAGRATDTGEREWPIRIGRNALIVVYRIKPDRVVIGRIFDSRQERKPEAST